MKKKLSFSTVTGIVNNWDELDGLKNDEVIKAFQIRNILESKFKSEKDALEKVNKKRQELSKQINEKIEKEAEGFEGAQIQQTRQGVQFIGLPDETRKELSDLNEQLNNFGQKKHTVEFDGLTKEDLKKHNLLDGKILRLFSDIIDLEEKQENKNMKVVKD